MATTSGTSRISVASSSAPTSNEPPHAMFLLHKLPVEVNEDLDVISAGRIYKDNNVFFLNAMTIRDDIPDLIEQLAEANITHLKAILDTPLNYSGKVQTIYINFFLNGLYEFRKPGHLLLRDLTPQKFEGLIREMFRAGRLVNPTTHEEIARRLPDMDNLLGALPRNCYKIGVESGPNPYDSVIDLEEFVNPINHETIPLFVVGDFGDTTIRRNMDVVVRVSESELLPATCLGYIVTALARKWNIIC